jgi:hypothetical protein
MLSSRIALLYYYVVAACAAISMMPTDAFQSPLVVVTPPRPLSGLSMSRSGDSDRVVSSRRMAIEAVFGLAASSAAALLVASSAPPRALALDMDAFVSSQVRQDGKQNAP